MSSIYELTADYMQIMEMMENPDLDPQALADTFEGIDGALEDKADSYAKVRKNLESDVEGLDNEIRRLTSRKKAIENNIKRMNKVLLTTMITTGKTKFKTDLFSFGIQKNAPSVVIDTDINNLPTEFLKFREPEVDKTKLKEALKNGEDLEGFAHLEQTSSLRIR
jgi:hypothetical protein